MLLDVVVSHCHQLCRDCEKTFHCLTVHSHCLMSFLSFSLEISKIQMRNFNRVNSSGILSAEPTLKYFTVTSYTNSVGQVLKSCTRTVGNHAPAALIMRGETFSPCWRTEFIMCPQQGGSFGTSCPSVAALHLPTVFTQRAPCSSY